MPFCPECRSEFRPGFDVCASCGGVALVDELPEIEELSPANAEHALPVGLASDPDIVRIQQIEGRAIDLLRVFPLKIAQELQVDLSETGLASLIVPVPVTFPDMMPRFELRVKADERERAEAYLRESWAESLSAEGLTEAASSTDVDQCPACGAQVPLDVDTCPECGLFVGSAEEEQSEDAP